MSEIVIYGPPMSTFVRSARMACAEKGVPHVCEEVDFRAESYRALHPFNKVPAMRHGDFVLFETAAIARYVDRTFPGPPLQPADARAAARMEQWISATMDYVYDVMIRALVWERLVMPMGGGPPDEAKIAAALPQLRNQFGIVEATLRDGPYLAGASYSLADLMLFPILAFVRATPEGEGAFAAAPAVTGWFDRVAARPAAAATDPVCGT